MGVGAGDGWKELDLGALAPSEQMTGEIPSGVCISRVSLNLWPLWGYISLAKGGINHPVRQKHSDLEILSLT